LALTFGISRWDNSIFMCVFVSVIVSKPCHFISQLLHKETPSVDACNLILECFKFRFPSSSLSGSSMHSFINEAECRVINQTSIKVIVNIINFLSLAHINLYHSLSPNIVKCHTTESRHVRCSREISNENRNKNSFF